MPKSEPIRVMLLEDEEITKLILTEIFANDRDLALIGSFNSVSAGLAWLDNHAPDVLLADLHLQDGLSLPVIRKCSERYSDCSIMMLTGSSEAEHIDSCLAAGVHGYLLKQEGLQQIGSAVKELVSGSSPMSGCVLRHVLETAKTALQGFPTVPAECGNEFTPREIEVLRQLERGLTYEASANELGISKYTLENYVKRVYRKLNVNTRIQAVFEAKRRNLF